MSRASWGWKICGDGPLTLPDGHCPNATHHTPCPADYASWMIWAERMTKGFEQTRCPGCGLYLIWEARGR